MILTESKYINTKEEMIQMLSSMSIVDNCSEPIRNLFLMAVSNFNLLKFAPTAKNLLKEL